MLSILCLFISLVQAQDRELTIQEAIGGYHLYPENMYYLQWVEGSELYSYLKLSEEGNFIAIADAKNKKAEIIGVGVNDLNEALTKAKKDSITRVPRPIWIDASHFGFQHKAEFLSYDVNARTVSKRFSIKEGASEIVYTKDLDGYAGVIEKGFAYQVGKYFGQVTSPDKGIEIGTSVHRSEFGIQNGLFPSPDGSKLAYYYKDERMVTEYPRYALNTTPASADMIRYPTAGAKSHHVNVRIKTVGGDKEDIVLKVDGPKEQYLTNVSWTPDNKYVLIAVVNRAQNHMWLNKYDVSTGEFVKTLFEEEHEKYVEPEHPAEFLSNDPSKFVWWSERDGYNHLYLYDAEGNMIQQMTKGEWIVTEFHGFNEEGSQFYITATKESPLERHLYCVDLMKGKMKKLTDGEGVHSITPNSENTLFLDNYSSPKVPREIRVIDQNGKVVNTLLEAENPLNDYKKVAMELGSLKADDGTDLYYRVFKPADFDPNKKYPAVVYLYNGPHLQLITKSWNGGANHWYHYMAQNGYVVFSIDGRGSANRGLEFENAVFRDLGAKEMSDQLTGLEWLKTRSYVDSSRVGIHGWSFGGYMTLSLMTRTPGKYKVGIAGGPVIDWKLYEVMYTERYMDTPKENPEGYEQTDLKNYVTNLQGDLLVIHGGQDNVVLWEHTLEYLQTAIQSGVQFDYFVYPHHEHNVLGRDRIHLYEKISNYFFENL